MEPAGEPQQTTTEAAGSAHPVAPDAPSRVDRIFIRLSVLNTILAVAGVFTGAVALYAALVESDAVRRQSAAAVWPLVQLSMVDEVREDGPYFGMFLTNAGVGPARVESMQVTIGGDALGSWQEVVDTLVPEAEASFGQAFAVGRVLRPGEHVAIVHTRDPALFAALRSAVAEPGNALRYCYCSIFEECWAVDSRDSRKRPQPQDQCPDFGARGFGV